MGWITPKTNWKSTDSVEFKDYNRIKNNLSYLHQRGVELILPFSIEPMGGDITSYEATYDVDAFNKFERNLDIINKNTFRRNWGVKQVFYPNGAFIGPRELNRIESAMLDAYIMFENQEAGIRRIPFTLGNFKGIRI